MQKGGKLVAVCFPRTPRNNGRRTSGRAPSKPEHAARNHKARQHYIATKKKAYPIYRFDIAVDDDNESSLGGEIQLYEAESTSGLRDAMKGTSHKRRQHTTYFRMSSVGRIGKFLGLRKDDIPLMYTPPLSDAGQPLYQLILNDFQRDRLIEKLSTAASRQQPCSIYVAREVSEPEGRQLEKTRLLEQEATAAAGDRHCSDYVTGLDVKPNHPSPQPPPQDSSSTLPDGTAHGALAAATTNPSLGRPPPHAIDGDDEADARTKNCASSLGSALEGGTLQDKSVGDSSPDYDDATNPPSSAAPTNDKTKERDGLEDHSLPNKRQKTVFEYDFFAALARASTLPKRESTANPPAPRNSNKQP